MQLAATKHRARIGVLLSLTLLGLLALMWVVLAFSTKSFWTLNNITNLLRQGAMTAILCKGLDGRTPQEILDLPSDFVTRIVGSELVRVRSQTIYYVLSRIKGICKVYLDRQRMAEVA